MHLSTPPFLIVLAIWFCVMLVITLSMGIARYRDDRKKRQRYKW